MMKTLTELSHQLHDRRKTLALNQKDMLMKIGMSQQQYQRIESAGDLRLSTLFRILEGLDLELMLVPGKEVQYLTELLAGADGGGVAEAPAVASTETSVWSHLLAPLEDEE